MKKQKLKQILEEIKEWDRFNGDEHLESLCKKMGEAIDEDDNEGGAETQDDSGSNPPSPPPGNKPPGGG